VEFILVFIFGLFIGSFLNVLADRLPRGETVVKGRSHCEKCKETLQWYDLIPLASFIFLKGGCRYCHTRLSFIYPIVEITTGALFVITTIFVLNNFKFSISNFQFLISLIYYLFIVSSLIVIFFADLKYEIIPDKIILPAIVVSALYLMSNTQYAILPYLLSALGASLFFLLLFLITKGKGMGLGDVKFAFLMGLILGFPNIVISLYVAFLTGAIIGVALILWKRRKMSGATIPFGPFLVLGTLTALFWGEIIFQKTISLLSLH